ncbi:hypothetical protein O6H91_03G053700 [Diphasiastrum complanatum]|uniref:Uncharacterized protein n=1 Tax=Diphasiastrum complanatum TaxID=34168 RepID=A0ACC2E6E3_DIPCM|nr:hypothetical protein O6H91_03G053700 [Diphasiastrum complanatum]
MEHLCSLNSFPPTGTFHLLLVQFACLESSEMSFTNHTSTEDPASNFSNSKVNAKILIFSMVVLLVVILFVALVHLYVRYKWMNFTHRPNGQLLRMGIMYHEEALHTDGLDKSVVNSLPIFVYSKDNANGKAAIECSVCLSEFQENETGRLLPKCSHSFHIACIDMWFDSHSSCPLCRASVGEHRLQIPQESVDQHLHGHDELGTAASAAPISTNAPSAAHETRHVLICQYLSAKEDRNTSEAAAQFGPSSQHKEELPSWNAHTGSHKLAHLVIDVPSINVYTISDRSAATATPPTTTYTSQGSTTPTSHLHHSDLEHRREKSRSCHNRKLSL